MEQQKPAASEMTPQKLIKLMLIRIGDEKREEIQRHVEVLKTKIVNGFGTFTQEVKDELISVIQNVICNMPHKVMIYAALMALVAQADLALAKDIIEKVWTQTMDSKEYVDAFHCKNVSRFFGQLVSFGVVKPSTASEVLTTFLNKSQCQSDLAYHCVLIVLTTESAASKLNGVSTLVKNYMTTKRVSTYSQRQKMMGLTDKTKDCVQELFDIFQSKGESFKYVHCKFYLSLSEEKLTEISQSFNDSNSIGNLTPVFFKKSATFECSFDNQLNRNLDQKNYEPMFVDLDIAKEGDIEVLERYQLWQLSVDIIFAFQESIDMAVDGFKCIYLDPSMKEYQDTAILQAIFSYFLNFTDRDFTGPKNIIQNQSSPKPMIHFTNIILKLIPERPNIFKKFEAMVKESLAKYDFGKVSGEGKFIQNLLESTIFINSQTQQGHLLVNAEFLQSIVAMGEQYKVLVHYYLSYACTLGFYKIIQEKLPDELHEYMPNQDNLKPTYQYVKNKDHRRDRSMSEDGDNAGNSIDAQVEEIMNALSQKGSITEGVKTVLDDKSKIPSDGEILKQIFLECILIKFGRSLEHLSIGIGKVKEIFAEHYQDNEEAQKSAISQIFKYFNLDLLTAQNYQKENLFQVRNKVVRLVLKFNQYDIFSSQAIIKWCIDGLSSLESGQFNLEYAQSQLILSLLLKVQQQREHVIALYTRDIERPKQVRIETPYEKRQREYAEKEGRTWTVAEDLKEKSPEQIQMEISKIESGYREQFKVACENEKKITTLTLQELAKNAELSLLHDKVYMISHMNKI